MKRALKDTSIAAGTLLLLITMLASVDTRVREQVWGLVSGSPTTTGELATVARQVRHVSAITFEAAKEQSVEHAPLTVFGVAAVVLVLFMVRT
jgi:hypothetical protein